jgi:hypothetical protein
VRLTMIKPTAMMAAFGLALGVAAPRAEAQNVWERLKKSAEANKPKPEEGKTDDKQKPTGGGSVSSGLGATNLHGLDDFNKCMALTSGQREKLLVQVLQTKLGPTSKLPADDRRKIEDDIQWLTAVSNGATNLPAPDSKNPPTSCRWTSWA